MLYCIIAINCLLGFAINCAFYPTIGILILLSNILLLIIGCNNSFGKVFVGLQMKHWGDSVSHCLFENPHLLMSVACLSFSLKAGAAVTLFVETGAVIMIAFCLLIAFGYFFDGAASGMTAGLSYEIARFVVKLFSFISIGFDKIAEWIAKAELHILGIET